MSEYTELVKALRDDNACLSIKTLHEAADAIDTLQRACANYAEQACENETRWIPVTERLPQEEKEYWCFCRGGAWKQLSWMDRFFWNGERFELPWGGEYDEVTHWMPLPTPPKEETE